MQLSDTIPNVEWIPCGTSLPTPGKYVWVVLGRVVEHGDARRYVREVAMGVYQDGRFQIYPYHTPVCSTEVWAWARMVPPEPPFCRTKTVEGEFLNSEDDDD